ncbi:MAG: carbon-nitrogen hydrolase family protein [Rhodospirillaceae bacterium]|nr:carbon-nitrogen hydrolase family protein [Rhodospirillaceae bacterium]
MRASVFQCAGGGLTPDQRLNKLTTALMYERPDLVVCPELFMSGYNVGDDLPRLAEPSHGPFARKVAALAQASGTTIVYGYPERDGDNLYNAAVCIGAEGQVIANHRKMLLPPPGFEGKYFKPGDGLTLFDLNGLCCAILICYDAEFPESVRAAVEAGAQVILVPTALVDKWPSVAWQMMPTRAFENGVWLLYANHAGAENGADYLGASCIVAPDGTDAARAGVEEQLIFADVDSESVTAAQERLPYLKNLGRLRDIVG